MSNLIEFAKSELEYAKLFDKDSDYDGMLAEAVMELIKLFSEQGHSGCSASMTIALFTKLAKFEAISPITGEDSEWIEVGTGVWQNKRCSTVFKDTENEPYDIDGIIFREPNGMCYTSIDSRVKVTFPYTPVRKYVDVPARSSENDIL